MSVSKSKNDNEKKVDSDQPIDVETKSDATPAKKSGLYYRLFEKDKEKAEARRAEWRASIDNLNSMMEGIHEELAQISSELDSILADLQKLNQDLKDPKYQPLIQLSQAIKDADKNVVDGSNNIVAANKNIEAAEQIAGDMPKDVFKDLKGAEKLDKRLDEVTKKTMALTSTFGALVKNPKFGEDKATADKAKADKAKADKAKADKEQADKEQADKDRVAEKAKKDSAEKANKSEKPGRAVRMLGASNLDGNLGNIKSYFNKNYALGNFENLRIQVNSTFQLMEQAVNAFVNAKNDGHDWLECQADLAKVGELLNHMENTAKTRPELIDVVQAIVKGKEDLQSHFKAHGIES